MSEYHKRINYFLNYLGITLEQIQELKSNKYAETGVPPTKLIIPGCRVLGLKLEFSDVSNNGKVFVE